MLLQAFDAMVIVYVLIATILLWLMLFFATGWIAGKSYRDGKKIAILIAALLIVLILPTVAGFINSGLNIIGEFVASLRDLIDGGGHNHVSALGSIVSFLLFLIIFKFIVGTDWKDTVWISLLGMLLLFILYSLLPELDLTSLF